MICTIYSSRNLLTINEVSKTTFNLAAVWVKSNNILFIVFSFIFKTSCRTCRSDNFGTIYKNRKNNYFKNENCLF